MAHDTSLVIRDAQRLALIRRAAGVDNYIGQGAPGYHFGRYICLHCSDDRHVPPYRPFRLDTHIQQHLVSNPDHRVRFYCWDCGELEDKWRLDSPSNVAVPPQIVLAPPGQEKAEVSPLPSLPMPVKPSSSVHPFVVLTALSVLKKAGIIAYPSPPVAQRLGLPEPEIILLSHSEAESLRAIRETPGITTRAIAEKLGLVRHTITGAVRMLSAGGHMRRGEYEDAEKLYPIGDRPIGHVRPRERARVTKDRRRQGGSPNG